MLITSELIRAARALLRWEQKDLAEKSGVSLPSIKRLETQPGPLAAQDRTVAALGDAIRRAGVEFTNGGQPGVQLRRLQPGERVRRIDTGEEGIVSGRVPTMGEMVDIDFPSGPLSLQRHTIAVVSPA